MRIGIASAGIKVDHVSKCFQASVVHVRRALSDVAKGRGLERAGIRLEFGVNETSLIDKLALGVNPDSQVVKLTVRKQRVFRTDGVTRYAVALVLVFEDR